MFTTEFFAVKFDSNSGEVLSSSAPFETLSDAMMSAMDENSADQAVGYSPSWSLVIASYIPGYADSTRHPAEFTILRGDAFGGEYSHERHPLHLSNGRIAEGGAF